MLCATQKGCPNPEEAPDRDLQITRTCSQHSPFSPTKRTRPIGGHDDANAHNNWPAPCNDSRSEPTDCLKVHRLLNVAKQLSRLRKRPLTTIYQERCKWEKQKEKQKQIAMEGEAMDPEDKPSADPSPGSQQSPNPS